MRVPWYVGLPLVALVATALVYWFANRSMYFPSQYPRGYWDRQHGAGARDVWLDSGGVRIHSWYVERESSHIITLFFHGNAGNVTHRFPRLLEVVKAGSSLLVIDYRGYGRSGGSPSESGLCRDADAAYDWALKKGFAAGQIILHGESLGTAVAVDLASRRPCGGLILEAPFTSASEVAGTVVPVLGPLLIRSFDSRDKIARVHAPSLFIHGDQDRTIPLRLGQALFAAAREPKQMWVVPGADHNDLAEIAGAAYAPRLKAFYESLAETGR